MEPTLEGALALARSATGPLSPHLPAFITSLIDLRYAVVSVRAKAWRAVAFDTWLVHDGVELADVNDAHIDQFYRRDYQPRSDCRARPHRHESFALRQLLRYLQGHPKRFAGQVSCQNYREISSSMIRDQQRLADYLTYILEAPSFVIL